MSDSAYDTSGQNKSQHSWIVTFKMREAAAVSEASLSLGYWESHRWRQKASSSSSLCDALSGSQAMSSLFRIANLKMAMRITGHRHVMPLIPERSEPPSVLSKQSATMKDPEGQHVFQSDLANTRTSAS